LVTVAMGAPLTAAPARTARVLGLGPDPGWARAIGLADLAIGSALLSRRRRWAWMVARAALNAVIAQRYRAESRAPGGSPRARGGVTAMAALTVVDATLARLLWRSGST